MTVLSICICTFKRPGGVRQVLDDLTCCGPSGGAEWEVLVVDNAPSDATRQVVDVMSAGLPVRYVPEPAAGLSNARNRGIAASSGDVVWFIDDDVRVDPRWLSNALRAVREWGQCSYFAGRVVPDFLGVPPPRWLAVDAVGPASHAGTYLSNDHGTGTRPFEGNVAMMGANMGFRRDVFLRLGGFRTDLDPAGPHHRLGGDTEFWERLVDAGEAGVYVGGATVHHLTPANRLTRRYALRWSYHHGWSAGRRKAVRLARAGRLTAAVRVGELAKNTARLMPEAAATLGAAFAAGPARHMAAWMRLVYRAGRVVHDLGPRPDLELDYPWHRGTLPRANLPADRAGT